jgi:hypothetical protein
LIFSSSCFSLFLCQHLGTSEQQTTKTLDVLFTPRFLKCDERQHIDMKQEQSILECSYSGNPAPTLTWQRKSEKKPIQNESGITIETKDEYHGRYKSILKFDRTKLGSLPSTIATTLSTNPVNSSIDNYYQQLLDDGFTVQLTVNGNDRGTRAISVIYHVDEIRLSPVNSSTSLCLSWILLLLLCHRYLLQC